MCDRVRVVSCDSPTLLLAFVRGRLSQRKDRLLAVAFCSVIRDLILDEHRQNAIDVAEAFADGLASPDELRVTFDRLIQYRSSDAYVIAAESARYCVQPNSPFASMLTLQRALSASAYRKSLDVDTP